MSFGSMFKLFQKRNLKTINQILRSEPDKVILKYEVLNTVFQLNSFNLLQMILLPE